MKHWTPQQLTALRRLRDGFLSRSAGARDYWRSPEELELYDATFAQRIGWKWDAVLHEVRARGWQPQGRVVLDWGCGTGVGHRRVLAAFPGLIQKVQLYDRSPLAVSFAAGRLGTEVAGVEVETFTGGNVQPGTLLVVSHVLSELPDAEVKKLLRLAEQADEILWVEAGTHADSRALIDVREHLRGSHLPLAPCAHAQGCGLLAARHAAHWCHHFATPPSQVFQDARWAELSRELGIDLRSLPYSFLLMSRKTTAPEREQGTSRVIGRTRDFKGFSKVLSCQAPGVSEFMLQKRDAPRLLRDVQEQRHIPLYRWTLSGEKIVGGEPRAVEESADAEPERPK